MSDGAPKRSLILAGGGIKVAFQAGVLQVWLDEAGLRFDHADGCSGGVFNLAMLCQGMSGTEIADAWRNTNPRRGVDFRWLQYLRLIWAESLFSLDAYRDNVFTSWGLDWDRIRASQQEATFNAYNFSRHRLEVMTPDEMTEDRLIACVSLPMWFPPADIGGDTWIDAVYRTDANIDEAIRRGADELWVVWTVSDAGEWHDGFVANYFQIIETAAVGRFRYDLQRIEENNREVAAGRHGHWGRHIDVKVLKAEVALHYLVNFSRDRLTEAVNHGVQAARDWCAAEGIPLDGAGAPPAPEAQEAPARLRFSERMRGYIAAGPTDPRQGYRRGRESGEDSYLEVRLTIEIDDVERFVTWPDHEAAVSGTIQSPLLGGERPVQQGTFNLFVDRDHPSDKRMHYRLWLADEAGNPLTLWGVKEIHDDPGLDVWSDTTRLYTRILRGHVAAEDVDDAPVEATGIIRIHLPDFLKQMTTFRAEAPTVVARAKALTRFGRLFLGDLWDVYAREILDSGPF